MRSSSPPVDRPRRLRRWLRYSWLSRLPLVGQLFRPRKPQAPPRPTRKSTALDIVQLEASSVHNDPFGMAQAALIAPALADMAVALQTPAPVLLHGYSGNATIDWHLDPTPAAHGGTEADASRRAQPDHADAFFVGLRVTARPEDTPEQLADPHKEPVQNQLQTPWQGEETPHLVQAPELMRDPVDDDFLRRLDQTLDDPLPADAGSAAGPAVAGPEETEPAPVAVGDDGSSGPLPSSDSEASASAGGGGGASEAAAPSDPFFPALTRPAPLAAAPVNGSDFVAPPLVPAAASLPATGDAAPALAPVAPPAVGTSNAPSSVPAAPPSPPSLVPDFGRLRLRFEPNLGQGSPGTSFLAHGAGYGIALAPDGISLALTPPAAAGVAGPRTPEVVQIHLAGATAEAGLVGRDELP